MIELYSGVRVWIDALFSRDSSHVALGSELEESLFGLGAVESRQRGKSRDVGLGMRGFGVSGGRRGRVAGRCFPRGGHLHAAVRRVIVRRALRRAPDAATPATAPRPLTLDLLGRARRPDGPPGGPKETRRGHPGRETRAAHARTQHQRAEGRSRATTRAPARLRHHETRRMRLKVVVDAKLDWKVSSARCAGISTGWERPPPPPRLLSLDMRAYPSRSNATTRTVPPSPPLPRDSLHHVVVFEHFPGFVLVPPPRSSRGVCVSSSGDDDVTDALGHPREMPRRSKRPRGRATLLHP